MFRRRSDVLVPRRRVAADDPELGDQPTVEECAREHGEATFDQLPLAPSARTHEQFVGAPFVTAVVVVVGQFPGDELLPIVASQRTHVVPNWGRRLLRQSGRGEDVIELEFEIVVGPAVSVATGIRTSPMATQSDSGTAS